LEKKNDNEIDKRKRKNGVLVHTCRDAVTDVGDRDGNEGHA
jgi:hypothetical protein